MVSLYMNHHVPSATTSSGDTIRNYSDNAIYD